MKGVTALCAATVIRDVETDSVSLINLIDDLTIVGVPGIIPSLSCIFIVEKEADDTEAVDAEVVFALGDTEVLRGPVTLQFSGMERFRQILHIQGLIVPGPGMLRVKLLVDGNELIGWDILIRSPVREPQMRLALEPGSQAAPAPAPTRRARRGVS